MNRAVLRVAAISAAGALAAVACLVMVYANRAPLTLEMDRELPRRIVSGVYPPERAGERTFAWTSRRADFRFRGLTRRSPWTCLLLVRGGRGDPARQPAVDIAADGITLARRATTDDYEEIEVTAPIRPQPGLVLSVASSSTLVPASDPRELGVQIDRLSCRPADGRFTVPPSDALRDAAIAGAAWGAALALCLPMTAAIGGVVLLALAQALPLASGTAPYGPFSELAVQLSLWLAGLAVVSVRLVQWRKADLSFAAKFVLTFSAAVLYLKLLGLLHPSKALIDVVFHAHRLQAVLDGGYYFTQVMPSGVTFPYAIGLYVVSAPWSWLTRDYVMLLRIVVSAAEALAGALLYVAVVRNWNDRLSGALAVVLFHTIPLPYGLIGNANLTNAFGQAAALIAATTAAIWSLRWPHALALAGFFALVSLAFLSHISTAAHLGVTLVVLVVLWRWLGAADVKAPAVPVLAVTVLAAAFSWVLYYGHFTEVYATALSRMRVDPQAVTVPEASNAGVGAAEASPEQPTAGRSTILTRTADALRLTTTAIGWPVGVLCAAGVWLLWRDGARDRLTLLLAALIATYLLFLGVGVVPRVEARFERYAAEFVGRVVFATYGAAVVLAAFAGASGWRAGSVWRIGSLIGVFSALSIGLAHWRRWFE